MNGTASRATGRDELERTRTVQGANNRQHIRVTAQTPPDGASPADVTTLLASLHVPAMPRYLSIKVRDAIQAESGRRVDRAWNGPKVRVPAPRG
jgi:hypothetical protein